MAFIIVADSKSQEIERRELGRPVIIGRSPECDLPVRDILLSRKHCVIERLGETWVIADLGSKNGTYLNGDLIQRHELQDCDVIRIGRTRIAFRDGPFVPAPPDVKRARQRPADPLDAMAGTLSGFRFSEQEEQALDQRVLETFPRPKPHPADPRSYREEKVQSMIADIASSAWDSVLVEGERKSVATLPRPRIDGGKAVPSAKPQAAETQVARRTDFDPLTAMMLFFIGASALFTGVCVWVISWSW
jgi:pSer/pThr/pTyr-binding forkhead associated (FHA) protein